MRVLVVCEFLEPACGLGGVVHTGCFSWPQGLAERTRVSFVKTKLARVCLFNFCGSVDETQNSPFALARLSLFLETRGSRYVVLRLNKQNAICEEY